MPDALEQFLDELGPIGAAASACWFEGKDLVSSFFMSWKSLFSDRHRSCKIAGVIAILFFLCLYSLIYGPKQKFFFTDCMKNPDACEGKTVLAIVGTVLVVEKDRFRIKSEGEEIWVLGRVEGLTVGKYLDVVGIFHKEGFLQLAGSHVYRERKLKIGLSLIPVGILFYLVLYHFFLKGKSVQP